MRLLPLAAAVIVALASLGTGWGRTTLRRDRTPIRPQVPGASRMVADKVFLERADELRKGRTDDYQVVVGNVLFRRAGMYMYCDSALFFETDSVEAFGNIRMEQGDTLFVYADQLVYGGNTRPVSYTHLRAHET